MSSYSNCQAVDMAPLLWFSLLFTHLPAIDSVTGRDHCLKQPSQQIWRKISQTVDLQCTVSQHCPVKEFQYEWFVFKEDTHQRLRLPSDKYSLKEATLHIKSLHANDSGIYHCAAFSKRESGCCAHHVGPGQTLIVRDKYKPMVGHILLLLLLVLLAVYSLAILTLILKKYGCNMKECRKTEKSHEKNSSKKTQFRDVLQEMHRKGNLQKGKQTASGDNVQAETAHNDLDGSGEGIYQNI
ncbi:unnamed protein product [Ophioblennius macclurei]